MLLTNIRGNSAEDKCSKLHKLSCVLHLVDGGFSEWSLWTKCTKTCDGGVRERNRTCSNPFPEYGGLFVMANILRKKAVLLASVQVRFFMSVCLYLLI